MPFWGQDDPPPPFWGHEPVPHIDADTAAKAVEAGARIIDLGEPGDWLAGHIKGALLIEPELIDMELDKLKQYPAVIVAPHDQGLGEEVTASLREKDIDAAMLDGGAHAWRAAGHEVVRADGTPA